MYYAVYLNFVNRIARYHLMDCPWVRSDRLHSGEWRRDLPDLDSVFGKGLQGNVKAVVPCDDSLRGSTEARRIGCRD